MPPLRAMWLLNHTTAREFEVPMLKQAGIAEVYTPKVIPPLYEFRSGSVDYSEDAHLSIPPDDLQILNATDWYGHSQPISQEAWRVANRHFQLLFTIGFRYQGLASILRHFQGAVLLRSYGREARLTYATILDYMDAGRSELERLIQKLGHRFWYAQAYQHLYQSEPEFLASRAVYFPAGMRDVSLGGDWNGVRPQVLVVIPDIENSPYYQAIFREVSQDLAPFDFRVGGAQSLGHPDPRVMGYLTWEEYQRNMREMRAMYYPSREPNHVHYHPFEAVKQGMPLLFRAGGMLDRLGGENLPGRCRDAREVRHKLGRVMRGDQQFIRQIRQSQEVLLQAMDPQRLAGPWREGIARVVESLQPTPIKVAETPKKRVGVLLPEKYLGGTLRAAQMVAQAIAEGSQQAGEAVEVVLGHLDDPQIYPEDIWSDLPASIRRRPFTWRRYDRETASVAMQMAGLQGLVRHNAYQLPDDGMRQFLDCELWVVISDRLELPLLPLRPYVMFVYDYLQRYEPQIGRGMGNQVYKVAQLAERVMVTSQFTYRDALHFALIPAEKLVQLPHLLPDCGQVGPTPPEVSPPYFIWSTNLAPHKNHERALWALGRYYDELDGQLECHVTGVNTGDLLERIKRAGEIYRSSPSLQARLKLLGYLPDNSYRKVLQASRFLWHPARVDNGTFGVVEAAWLGVPSLSSDYPAMREMEAQYDLGLLWADSGDEHQMATRLKEMEQTWAQRKQQLPTPQALALHSASNLATVYWAAVRDLL
jgi:glycosyltransferase involved in cell wall biosynthesis